MAEAETTGKLYYHQEEKRKQVEEENENEENASSMMPDSSFLLRLNLVMVIASLSLSDQELSEFEDMEKFVVKAQQDYKATTKLHARKRGYDELKIPERQASQSRVRTKALDSRHGRRV